VAGDGAVEGTGRGIVSEQPGNFRTALRHTAALTIVTLVLWLLLLFPAWSLAGLPGLEGLSYAALLCLVPGWLLIWMSRMLGGSGQQVPVLAMAGSGFRMLFVLCGTLVVQSMRKPLGFREFLVWLIVLYLATLLVETLLVLVPAAGTGSPKPDHASPEAGGNVVGTDEAG